jgi:hypothetical protein
LGRLIVMPSEEEAWIGRLAATSPAGHAPHAAAVRDGLYAAWATTQRVDTVTWAAERYWNDIQTGIARANQWLEKLPELKAELAAASQGAPRFADTAGVRAAAEDLLDRVYERLAVLLHELVDSRSVLAAARAGKELADGLKRARDGAR